MQNAFKHCYTPNISIMRNHLTNTHYKSDQLKLLVRDNWLTCCTEVFTVSDNRDGIRVAFCIPFCPH